MLKCMIGTKYILSIVGKGERDVVMSSNNSKEIVIYIYNRKNYFARAVSWDGQFSNRKYDYRSGNWFLLTASLKVMNLCLAT